VTFRPDHDTWLAMTTYREAEGVPYSEQIRRALRFWLEAKGVMKAERKRAAIGTRVGSGRQR
jgi:hypothetical protein